jgi:hypothetical protein
MIPERDEQMLDSTMVAQVFKKRAECGQDETVRIRRGELIIEDKTFAEKIMDRITGGGQ